MFSWIGKTKRLKQAKEEAIVEIEAYKSEREKAYKALEQQMLGSKTDSEGLSQKKTEIAIEDMGRLYEKNKATALQEILNVFTAIKPETHKNLVVDGQHSHHWI